LVGPTWSFLGSATLPVIDRLQLTTIMPATTTEVVEGKSKYLFHGSLKTDLMQKNFEDFFIKNSIKKIALVGNNDAWSGSIAKPIYAAAKNTGAEIIIHEQLAYGSESGAMPTIVGKIKQKSPDIVIFSIFDEEGIMKLVMDSRNQGITVPILSSDTTLQRTIKDGILDSQKYTNLYNIIPKNDESFKNKFVKKFESEPKVYTDRGYDALMILVEGVLNKGELSLDQYIKTKINYNGYAAQYDFDDNGDIIGGEWEIKKI
jgi:ABC-type branched-subunit amino acid transport system substrate-binding protein